MTAARAAAGRRRTSYAVGEVEGLVADVVPLLLLPPVVGVGVVALVVDVPPDETVLVLGTSAPLLVLLTVEPPEETVELDGAAVPLLVAAVLPLVASVPELVAVPPFDTNAPSEMGAVVALVALVVPLVVVCAEVSPVDVLLSVSAIVAAGSAFCRVERASGVTWVIIWAKFA